MQRKESHIIVDRFRRGLFGKLSILTLTAFASSLAWAQICATPGKDGNATGVNALGFGGTTQVVNTYYPGTGNVSAGATSIPVGPSRGAATTITAGDLLLVIQMQDASINSTNGLSYGDGVAGGAASGTTNDDNVGAYEYVQATGPVSGGSVPIQGATIGSGLLSSYVNAAATSTRGQRRYQVIRVPQYANCEVVGTAAPSPWNGTTGGVIAIDVDGTLTFFSGSAVSATGLGFRGGGGRQLFGGSGGTNTDSRSLSSSNFHGAKGEGIAGTPDFVHESFTGATPPGSVVSTGTTYPNGGNGRGAPGNAGGGGNDGNPSANDQNSGGGGGGNGGTGGRGGNSWSSNLAIGGFGGTTFGSASINRLVMGGGGGAATRNNSSDVEASGGAGGGIVLIRAATITGTGTVEANGIEPNAANGLLPANDGGGGGGAGGTLVVFGNAGSLANIALLANGGRGGDCALSDPAHGPGGGGGGGLIYVNDLLTGTVSVSGATNGLTTSSTIAYGATAGTDGNAFLNAQIPDLEDCGRVPVTLSYFRASIQRNSTVNLEWQTATEVGNIGFYIHGFDGTQWRQLNRQLIPSKVVDSDQPQNYNTSFIDRGYSRFRITDIDRFGQKTQHGTYQPNQSYGKKTDVDSINWPSIRTEIRRNEQARTLSREELLNPMVPLRVQKKGMHRVTYEYLRDQGFDLRGVPVSELALVTLGQPVPIHLHSSSFGEEQFFFGPGWSIDFLGDPQFNLYDSAQIYTLQINPQLAKRYVLLNHQRSSGPKAQTQYSHSFIREENNEYAFASPFEDPWFDTQLLTVNEPKVWNFSFQIDQLVSATAASLEIKGYGLTDFPELVDHHLRFMVNGQILGEWFGNGIEVLNRRYSIPKNLLRPGTNQVSIALPSELNVPAEVFNLEKISVSYQRPLNETSEQLRFASRSSDYMLTLADGSPPLIYAFDSADQAYYYPSLLTTSVRGQGHFTEFQHPFSGKGSATFHIARSWNLIQPQIAVSHKPTRFPSQQSDVLVITHPNFTQAMEPWLQARRAQGLRISLVEVNQIYQTYSHGNTSAHAIADYIADAKRQLGIEYVLLVGGDSYDYKNNLGEQSFSFVPTLYKRTGPNVGFAPSDAAMADVDQDGLPDIAIGRFPVRTVAELSVLVNKVLQYPNTQHAQDAIFVAGPDEQAISFSGTSRHLMDLMPQAWNRQEAFATNQTITQTRQYIINTINDGAAFVNFFGHSGPTMWTFDNLLSSRHVETLLTNANRPTIVTQWGCWNTYFVAPTFNTMAHKFLLSGNKGAATVIGASTLTEVSSEKQFMPVFFEKLFTPNTSIGQAMVQAKQQVALQYPQLLDIYLGLHILGDPTLILNP